MESELRLGQQESRKRAALNKMKTQAEETKKAAEGKTYGCASFAGLAAIPANHWDFNDNIPLSATAQRWII